MASYYFVGQTVTVRTNGQFLGPDGSATQPTFSFNGATNTGLYRTGTSIGLTVAGTNRATLDSSGNFTVDGNVAGPRGLFSGTNPQVLIAPGAADAGLRLISTTQSNFDQYIQFSDLSEDWFIGQKWNTVTGFGIGRANTKNDLVIDTSGNVGVGAGTSAITSLFQVFGSAGINTNLTVGGTLGVTGTTTLAAVNTGALSATTGNFSSTLAVSGASTLAGLSATTGAFSSTLNVTGTSTLGATNTGAFSATTGAFSSTLSVTGTSTLGVTNTGALSSTTGSFSSTLSVTGTSTLGVTNTGAFTGTTGSFSSTLAVSGTSTIAALSATNGTFSGTLGVTGTSTFAATSATTGSFSGTLTTADIAASGQITSTSAGNPQILIEPGAHDAGIELISTTSSSFDQYVRFSDPSEDWYVGQKWNTTTGFGIGRANTKNDFVIDSNGNVGIGAGTTGITSLFQVFGSAGINSALTVGTTLGVTGTSTLGVTNTGAFTATTGSFSSTLGVSGVSTLAAVNSDAITSTSSITAAASSAFILNGRSQIQSPADGRLTLLNNAATDFTRLMFGGTTSSFPALKRSSTTLAVRLADDSADAPLTASNLTASGTLNVTGTSTLGATNTGAFTGTTGSFSSTLSVTGTSTLGATNTGAFTATTGSFSSTLGVTGTSTLGTVNAGAITGSGALTISSGGAAITGNVSTTTKFLTANGTAAAPSYAFTNTTGMGLYRIGDNVLGIATSGAEAMRIDNFGFVAIGGTDTSDSILTIGNGSGKIVPYISGGNGTNEGAAINFSNGTLGGTSTQFVVGTKTAILSGSYSGDGALWARNAMAFYTNASSTAVMTLNTSAQVGIGTTSPGAKLEVYNAGDVQVNIKSSGANHYNQTLAFIDDTQTMYIGGRYATTPGVYGWGVGRTSSKDDFVVDVNGNTAVGGSFTLGSAASDPTGANGMIYYDTANNRIRAYVNGAWKTVTVA